MSLRVTGGATLLASLAVLATAPAEAGRRKAEPTLATLGQRTAPVDRTQPVVASSADATEGYEQFLQIPGADPGLRAQALRRLGDLRLDQALAASAGGGPEDAQATAAARQASAAYRQLLAEFPEHASRDAVLYQLARAEEAAGDAPATMAALDELVARHPRGAHADEAQFRRGEAYFSAQRYLDAERAYGEVLALPPGEFTEQALYKRGWAQFKLADHAASSASFLELLDGLLVDAGSLRAAGTLSRPEQELADDALRGLSLMFAAEAGAGSLDAALERHGSAPYESRLYRSLGDLYVEKERYQDAAETYRAFARRKPLDPDAPRLLGAATQAYERAGFVALVLESKREFVDLYGPRSAYWSQRGAQAIDDDVSRAVQANLLDLARHHHALAQASGSAADREQAVRWYGEYLDGFDAAPAAPATRLLLADLLFEGQRHLEAADQYEKAAYGYRDAPDAARAAYAGLVALDKAAAEAASAQRASLEARGIDSSLRFAGAFPTHAEVPGVLTRTTESLFQSGDRTRAEAVAQQVLALGERADANQRRVAWTVLAHTYFDSGRYAEAERAYGELLALVPAGEPLHGEAVERRAAAVYRQAEAKQAAGDVNAAVQDYLRVAQVAPASPIRASAEYDAATLLLGAGQWNEAIAVLERFRTAHPQHPLAQEVPAKLALAYGESGQPARAAAEYERVAAREDAAPDVRRAALWQAAELYASGGDASGAARAWADYVARFPAPAGPAIDARQELADLARAAQDAPARERWLRELVAAEGAAGAERSDRTRFLAAHASLELARPLDAQARAVRLALPLDKSLTAKRKALEAALGAYSAAEGYGVAGVSTASAYAMADLYRDLGRALLDSDRPPGLSAEELEQYDVLLEEQAFPFEEKAIGLHERNARLASQGLYDEWVRRSYADLAQLKPARYAREERTSELPPGALPIVVSAAAANREGVALRGQGEFAAARAAYERALAIDPACADAERNLAILLDLYLDDPAAALVHFERYQSLTQDSDREVTAWLVELRARIATITRTAEAQP
jgi:tetratricopeptide (TPR) repeat protein